MWMVSPGTVLLVASGTMGLAGRAGSPPAFCSGMGGAVEVRLGGCVGMGWGI